MVNGCTCFCFFQSIMTGVHWVSAFNSVSAVSCFRLPVYFAVVSSCLHRVADLCGPPLQTPLRWHIGGRWGGGQGCSPLRPSSAGFSAFGPFLFRLVLLDIDILRTLLSRPRVLLSLFWFLCILLTPTLSLN